MMGMDLRVKWWVSHSPESYQPIPGRVDCSGPEQDLKTAKESPVLVLYQLWQADHGGTTGFYLQKLLKSLTAEIRFLNFFVFLWENRD